MSTVLLDTNIVSYLFKQDTRAERYAKHLRNRELTIAVMTVAELFQWAAVRRWGEARIARLEQYLEHYTTLPVDINTCRQWATVRASRSAAGMPISP
jgi:tRNA(fMet)-specific endonuclease VapC